MRRVAGRLLREPLLHFLLAGAAVFAAYAWLHPESFARDASHRIELTQDDLRQIAVGWLAQGRPAPTPDEMRSLVESRIREELLYREALALGLDQGDTIVKRRLAQKMEFLFEDLSALREPTNGGARGLVRGARHGLRAAGARDVPSALLLARPSRRPGARRTRRMRSSSSRASRATRRRRPRSPIPSCSRTTTAIVRSGTWRSRSDRGSPRRCSSSRPAPGTVPIESGYGWHLVFVDSLTPARTPAFEEVAADVRSAWLAAQREEIQERALADLKARYEIVLPKDLAVSWPVASDGAQAMAAP